MDARDIIEQTPLHRVVGQQNREMMGVLFQQGADVDAEDKYGNTPLDRARQNHDRATTTLLMEAGAGTFLQKVSYTCRKVFQIQ